jgi:phage internal scaffolding protein
MLLLARYAREGDMKQVILRSFGVYDPDAVSLETGLACPDPSLAQQQFREECDINRILERFNVTGQLPVVPLPPEFGDFSGVFDYQTALNSVLDAQEAFDALPARVRERFANDPAAFVDFCLDEANKGELAELGLLDSSPTEAAPAAEAAQATT